MFSFSRLLDLFRQLDDPAAEPSSRRDFLGRALRVGAVLATAPALTLLTPGQAHASACTCSCCFGCDCCEFELCDYYHPPVCPGGGYCWPTANCDGCICCDCFNEPSHEGYCCNAYEEPVE